MGHNGQSKLFEVQRTLVLSMTHTHVHFAWCLHNNTVRLYSQTSIFGPVLNIQWNVYILDTIGNHLTVLIVLIHGQFCTTIGTKTSVHIREVSLFQRCDRFHCIYMHIHVHYRGPLISQLRFGVKIELITHVQCTFIHVSAIFSKCTEYMYVLHSVHVHVHYRLVEITCKSIGNPHPCLDCQSLSPYNRTKQYQYEQTSCENQMRLQKKKQL